jgi:hypothetical protein
MQSVPDASIYSAADRPVDVLFGHEDFTQQEKITLAQRLAESIPVAHLKLKPGKGDHVYLETSQCVVHANEVFGYDGWSDEIKKLEIVSVRRFNLFARFVFSVFVFIYIPHHYVFFSIDQYRFIRLFLCRCVLFDENYVERWFFSRGNFFEMFY